MVMRQKTATELQAEADEILAKLRQRRAQEAHQERHDARTRQSLLGVCLQEEMIADPALRARFETLAKRFFKRERDRTLFKLDESHTWFTTLQATATAAKERKPKLADAGRVAEAADHGANGGAVSATGNAAAARTAGATQESARSGTPAIQASGGAARSAATPARRDEAIERPPSPRTLASPGEGGYAAQTGKEGALAASGASS
ncbi:MAG: hypothetical protein JWN04_5011 [Myxococcaceae bacterium]|nr:hypothetical protein [Myxococcaceae bacterium]